MSWNAYLTDDRGHQEGGWNYTHNCNGMIGSALAAIGVADAEEIGTGPLAKAIGPAWRRHGATHR